jgi:hypothetical protein
VAVPGLVTAEPGADGADAEGSCWMVMAFLRERCPSYVQLNGCT